MVLVAVGYKKRLDFIGVFYNKRKIGDNDIYARRFFVGEGHAAVYKYHLVFVGVKVAVFADFAHTAKRYEFNWRSLNRLCFGDLFRHGRFLLCHGTAAVLFFSRSLFGCGFALLVVLFCFFGAFLFFH